MTTTPELDDAVKWLKSDEVNAGPRTLKAINIVLAALSQPDEARDARKEARQHFLHEFGSELNDGEKWREWLEAQRQIEEEMPEGYCVILECSPGDWSLRFTDPEGEDIQIDDHESTASFIRDAVAIAKERERAAMSKEQP